MVSRSFVRAMAIGGAIALAASAVAQTTVQELAHATRDAKGQFRTLTPDDAQQAKQALSNALDRLEPRLRADGSNGEAWRSYLKIDDLRTQLASETPDLSKLSQIYELFAGGQYGLELAWFADVRTALYKYVAVAKVVGKDSLRQSYEQVLDGLADQLDAYAKSPSTESAGKIVNSIRWLQRADQACDLVCKIRAALVQPNVLVQVSESTVDVAVHNRVNEPLDMQDCILGTSVHSNGQTTGDYHATLFPDETQGVIDTIFRGQTDTNSVGRNGPATIHSLGVTELASVKRVWMTEDGLQSWPASSNACTSTTITGVCTSSRLKIVQRIAEKRVAQQKGSAEEVAATHAQQRLNERMDQQGDAMIAKNNANYDEKFRQPLRERRLFPQKMLFSTSGTFNVLGLEADCAQVTGVAPPPMAVAGGDVNIRLHDSLVNNIADTMFSGMIMNREVAAQLCRDLFGSVPPALEQPTEPAKPGETAKPDAKGEKRPPSTFTFADSMPVTMSCGENTIQITLRGKRFVGFNPFNPEATSDPAQVVATYKLVNEGGKAHAVRKSLEAWPLDYVVGSNEAIPASFIPVRTEMAKRFEEIFPQELTGILKPSGSLAKMGTFEPTSWTSSKGWMQIVYHRVPQQPTPAPATVTLANQ